MNEERWRHSKTGNVYVVHAVLHANQGQMVAYQREGDVVGKDLAVHTETKMVWLLHAASCYPVDVGPEATLVLSGKHLWLRPMSMWRELVQVEGTLVPRFTRMAG